MALDGVKPADNIFVQQKPPQPKKYTRQIGGITFTGDRPISDKDIKVSKNYLGQPVYSVFLSDERKVVFKPNTNEKATISYSGDGKNPYTNPNILIAENLKGVQIYGSPNSQDFIYLQGESGGNKVIVDNDNFSLFKSRYHRQDHVSLSADTYANQVQAGKADYVDMHFYNGKYPDGEIFEVHGKKQTVDQAEFLQDNLTSEEQNIHARHRRMPK